MILDFEHNRYLFSQNYFIILEMYNAKIKASIRYSTTKTTTLLFLFFSPDYLICKAHNVLFKI